MRARIQDASNAGVNCEDMRLALQYVIPPAFYPMVLILSNKLSITFHPRLTRPDVAVSWRHYIFSAAMRCT